MTIGFATVKKLMQSSTSTPIADKAVHKMIQYVEEVIIEKTQEAVACHSQKNGLRQLQKLPTKKRISEQEIIKVISKEPDS